MVADHANLLRLPVQIVVKRTLCLSNHEAISQFCVEIVSNHKSKDRLELEETRESRRINGTKAMGYTDTSALSGFFVGL
jgi:hypothetical protein